MGALAEIRESAVAEVEEAGSGSLAGTWEEEEMAEDGERCPEFEVGVW